MSDERETWSIGRSYGQALCESLVREVLWLMRNSEGVVGLTLDGKPLGWPQVAMLYMPSWGQGW